MNDSGFYLSDLSMFPWFLRNSSSQFIRKCAKQATWPGIHNTLLALHFSYCPVLYKLGREEEREDTAPVCYNCNQNINGTHMTFETVYLKIELYIKGHNEASVQIRLKIKKI